MTTQKQRYVVLRIRDGETMYRGSSEARCAKALVPGTCYGKGADRTAAYIQAFVARQSVREKCDTYQET